MIDIVNGLMIVGGADTVRGNLNTLPYLYFDLVFIDCDHSPLMAAVWSALFAWICKAFYKSGKIAWFAFLCSILHWLTDVPVHNPDLVLYPYSDIIPISNSVGAGGRNTANGHGASKWRLWRCCWPMRG